MKAVVGFIFVIALTVACVAASNIPYALTKYDDPTFAEFCNSQLKGNNRLDAAIIDGIWGICGFSDPVDSIGPGSDLNDSAVYEHSISGWTLIAKGGGYPTIHDLELAGVPALASQKLLTAFQASVCSKGNIRGIAAFCKTAQLH